MTINVIFTGGTIASKVSENTICKSDAPYTLISSYEKKYGKTVDFITHEPYSILSENLNADYLNMLIHTVNALMDKGDGIVITHGTDSIQYTAAILGYIFNKTDIPILLVSSAYVLDDKRANGFDNFNGAVTYILEKRKPGIYISYKNPGEAIVRFHEGIKMLTPQTYSANMESLDINTDDALMKDLIRRGYRLVNEYFSDSEKINSFSLKDRETGILRLHVYPLLSYPSLSGIKAVIIEGYHSGTLCIDEALKAFANEAASKNIPIYLTGLSDNAKAYETVAEYKKMGILPITNSLPIALYCYLWITLSL